MRVLITGAGGFVGSYLIRHLRDREPDCEIVGTVQPSFPMPAAPGPNVRFVPCDIVSNKGADVRALMEEARPDRVFHLAGAASGASSDRDSVWRVNVDGTQFVLLAAQGIVPPERILFAGTGYVYGSCDAARPAREDDPLAAPDELPLYAASKRAAEALIQEHGGAVIARAFNHTGPGQTTAFAVPAFACGIVRVERGLSPCLQVGNLDALRDFLDVRDVVRAYRLLLEHGKAGAAYNVCSGVARSMRDVLREMTALARVPISLADDRALHRPSDITVSVGDPSRLAALTGWTPEIPFSQTLSDTLDWWRARPSNG